MEKHAVVHTKSSNICMYAIVDNMDNEIPH